MVVIMKIFVFKWCKYKFKNVFWCYWVIFFIMYLKNNVFVFFILNWKFWFLKDIFFYFGIDDDFIELEMKLDLEFKDIVFS